MIGENCRLADTVASANNYIANNYIYIVCVCLFFVFLKWDNKPVVFVLLSFSSHSFDNNHLTTVTNIIK